MNTRALVQALPAGTPPSLQTRFGSGLATVKWLALVLMVVDHVDAFVYGRELLWAGQLGRLVFPLFAFVIAYNLARPGAWEAGVHVRVLLRCLAFGAAALPFHWALTDTLTLNIMATFAVAVGVICWIERRRPWLALLTFALGGAGVEYWWPGVGLVVATWAWCRQPAQGFPVALLALASLWVVNGSHAALWALPAGWLALRLDVGLPRAKWVFWAFYPAHLATFWTWNNRSWIELALF